MGQLSWNEAKALVDNCKKAGGVVVTTNGTFDILHQGHVSYLHAARSMGDILIVGLNSDASVKRYKGPTRPINSETARAMVMAALRSVDAVCVFTEDTPVEWLQFLQPHIHVKGGDWDVQKIPETAVMAQWSGKVVAIPFVEGFSTTKIIEAAQGRK